MVPYHLWMGMLDIIT